MPRDFNVDDIPTDRRIFIKKQEWDDDETREYFFTGKEKIERTKRDSIDTYASYLIYLIPVGKEFDPELTLELFASQASPLKTIGVKPYQKIIITKLRNDRGYEDWEMVAGKEVMPEKQRPAVSDYPEMKPYVNKDEIKPVPRHGEEEVNIDDIPF